MKDGQARLELTLDSSLTFHSHVKLKLYKTELTSE